MKIKTNTNTINIQPEIEDRHVKYIEISNPDVRLICYLGKPVIASGEADGLQWVLTKKTSNAAATVDKQFIFKLKTI